MSIRRFNLVCSALFLNLAQLVRIIPGRFQDINLSVGCWLLAILVSWCLSVRVASGFNLVIAFQGGITESQQEAFAIAKDFWTSKINGYLPGIVQNTIVIQARGISIDGEGLTLGQAGPTQTTMQGGYKIAVSGRLFLDIADLPSLESSGRIDEVVTHEMGHVLGFGTLWTANGVYRGDSGEYTGENGLAAYRIEFSQPAATFVPVELGGDSGTVNTHWEEIDDGDGLTGITDPFGRDMHHELMTGWLNLPTFVSRTTIQSLTDIGFDVVPEPRTRLLLICGLVLIGRMLIKRRNEQSHKALRALRCQ